MATRMGLNEARFEAYPIGMIEDRCSIDVGAGESRKGRSYVGRSICRFERMSVSVFASTRRRASPRRTLDLT